MENANANKLFDKLKTQRTKMEKEKAARKSKAAANSNAAIIAKYAKEHKAIIGAKIYKNSLCYDMQLCHFAKADFLANVFGKEKAKLAKERCKAYAARTAEQKSKNQSGKSVLLHKDIADILLAASAEELAEYNVIIANDIIEKAKAKLAEKQKAAKAKATAAKKSKATAKATAKAAK